MRTDIHRPSAPEFNPENYEFVTCFDLHPEQGSTKNNREIVSRYAAQGYKFANAGFGCAHCGKNIRYAALMLHPSTMEMLYIGEQCLTNRFQSMTKAQFHALRENARLNRDRIAKSERKANFIAEHFEVQLLIDYVDSKSMGSNSFGFYGNGFLLSLYEQFNRNAELSEKQLSSIVPALEREKRNDEIAAERKASKDALIQAGVKAPEGRVTVAGKILGFKQWDDDVFGPQCKMIVQSNEGWKVYVTAPAGSGEANVGDEVSFSAALTPSQDDILFAYGKRPTKFTITRKVNA